MPLLLAWSTAKGGCDTALSSLYYRIFYFHFSRLDFALSLLPQSTTCQEVKRVLTTSRWETPDGVTTCVST